MLKKYYISGIVTDGSVIWNLVINDCVLSFDEAMKQVEKIKDSYDVLSIWVDMFEKGEECLKYESRKDAIFCFAEKKQIVYHEVKNNIYCKIEK